MELRLHQAPFSEKPSHQPLSVLFFGCAMSRPTVNSAGGFNLSPSLQRLKKSGLSTETLQKLDALKCGKPTLNIGYM